jgi:hemoglobin
VQHGIPDPKSPGYAVGIDHAMIERVVREFYGRLRTDPMLGPIFATAVGDEWEPHIQKLCLFWSSVLLMTGLYKGRPVPAHVGLPGLQPPHFAHWLAVFRETVGDICPPEAAAVFISRAERIAESLQMAIAISRGESIVPPRNPVPTTTSKD